jgi:hypothetical protein
MRFKGHAKLIDKCNVITRINGNEDFFQMKEIFVTSCLHELIDRAANQLAKAKLGTEHLVSFDLTVHAQEDANE